MNYKFGMYNYGQDYLAELHYHRNLRELAWGLVLFAATVTVWSLFMIQLASDAGMFGPLN